MICARKESKCQEALIYPQFNLDVHFPLESANDEARDVVEISDSTSEDSPRNLTFTVQINKCVTPARSSGYCRIQTPSRAASSAAEMYNRN